MRAKFGSVIDANVTDENCEFRFPTFFYHVNGNLGHSWRTCGRSEAKVPRSWQTLRFVASAALLSAHAWGVRVAHLAARKAACASRGA